MKSEHLHILQHSLGVDKHGQGNQYRNSYVIGPECSDFELLTELVALGLMKDHGPQELASGMRYFSVTDAGKEAMRLESPAPPKISRSKSRYLKWLHADCGMKFGDWLKQNMENYENECR